MRQGARTGCWVPSGSGAPGARGRGIDLHDAARQRAGAVDREGQRAAAVVQHGGEVGPAEEVHDEVVRGAVVARVVDVDRTARQHLRWVAQAAGISNRRVDEVLDTVGLTDVAGKKVGGFSLGMNQRLGIASALLGDPPVLLFDEPVNGLDPEGIHWIRSLMQRFADEGRTVFISSHIMSEMEQTADHVLVIGRGHLVADMTMDGFTQRSALSHVKVVTTNAPELSVILTHRGAAVTNGIPNELTITGMDAAAVGLIAFEHGILLNELSSQRASLEDAFMEMTRDSVEYHAETTLPPAAAEQQTPSTISLAPERI